MDTIKHITTFVVFDGHTFGFTTDSLEKPFIRLSVLGVQSLKGGDPQHLDKTVVATTANVRLATDQDFDDFRVSRKGYKDSDQYHWNKTGETK